MVKHRFCVVETTTWGDFDREKWYLHKVTHNHPVWMQEYARENGRFPKMVWKLLFQLDIAGFSVAMLNELVMTTVVTVKKRVSWAWLGDSRAEFFSRQCSFSVSKKKGPQESILIHFVVSFTWETGLVFPSPKKIPRPARRPTSNSVTACVTATCWAHGDTATTPGWLMSYWILQSKNWGRSQSIQNYPQSFL